MNILSLTPRGVVFVLFLLLLSAGCARHPDQGTVADVTNLPQDPEKYVPYLDQNIIPVGRVKQEKMAQEFKNKLFSPWRSEAPLYSGDRLYWGLDEFGERTLYAAQGLPYPQGWWASVRANADRDAFPSLARSGITVRTTDVRVLPTQEPVFFEPDQAGQGYPFDMMQNSVLWTSTPVRVVHRSRDQAWLLVETAWVFGWVRAEDVAWVDRDQAELLENSSLVAVTEDGFPLLDRNGTYQSRARIGILLCALRETRHGYRVALPTSGAQGHMIIRSGLVSRRVASPFPIKLHSNQVAQVAGEMMGQIYGWGDLYARRDCSAGIRNLFTPFGLWLPRNSSQ
ncbi:MAG: SH3 domain-containing protein, partial [Desulfovermiculus sp.]